MKPLIFSVCFILCASVLSAQSNNSSVISLDNMNVLYYGVDNPISISSPVDWNQTMVTITNGTLTGSGAHRIVRPAAVGQKTVITVTAKGLNFPYEYRVKRIPDPVFKVGSGKQSISVAEFQAQKFCRAEMENLDFDLSYKVKSATVYFSGKGFDNAISVQINGNNLSPLSAYASKCEPGTFVTFDNIKVEGPDGVRMLESRTYNLY
jgi:hypothetical protein